MKIGKNRVETKLLPLGGVLSFIVQQTRKVCRLIHPGATSGDEMCNLYLMYYTDEQGDEMRICGDEEVPSLTQVWS